MRNLAVIVMLLFFAILPHRVAAQGKALSRYQEELDRAHQLETELSYEEALTIYQKLEEDHGDDNQLKLAMANAYFKLHNLEESMSWYTQVFGKGEEKKLESAAPIHLYNYAELLLMDDRPEQALFFYQRYKDRNPDDSRTNRKIEGIEKRAQFEAQDDHTQISQLAVNSEYPDFSPAFYGNGLVFVSGRRTGAAEKGSASDYFDLYRSSYAPDGSFSKPEKFSAMINTDFHEGPVIFYDHDTRMIFTRNNVDGKMKHLEKKVVVRLQLLYSEKDSATGDWKKPVLLSINSPNYSVGHPAISRDGKHLYFSSDMPGGYGGTDLYVSHGARGQWGKPENLGAKVNTEGNEMFPFLHHDELLYFASDGRAGLGGLDVYEYNLGDQTVWNIRKPVNSNRDDLGLIFDEAGTKGYFSSNRGKGYTADDNVYSYSIRKPEPVVEKPAPVAAEPAPIAEAVEGATPVAIYYTVQLLAVRNSKAATRSFFRGLKGVMMYKGKEGIHRYAYGRYDTLDEAIAMLKALQGKGFSDAFVRREVQYAELSLSTEASIVR